MADAGKNPWLTIVGIGEDGPSGLCEASRIALEEAELVLGAERHVGLLAPMDCPVRAWPRPFDAGIAALLEHRGKRVVALASGDPFWFGAGSSLTRSLALEEWVAHPSPSSFALAASRLGWPVEQTACLALHAAPMPRLRPHVAPGTRAIVLVRDGEGALELGRCLTQWGFGASQLWVLEALGGARERIRETSAITLSYEDIAHPVAVAVLFAGEGASLPRASGIADHWFNHDGQITRRPIRALTLSSLAPRPGEMLWDIGSGSGSIAIEWLLAHPTTRAIGFEREAGRAARAQGNAASLGVDRLAMVVGEAPASLDGEPRPDVVFIGGGLSDALCDWLAAHLPAGTRLVANAVTLESEALLARWQSMRGGSLMRIELSEAEPLGSRRGWRAAYPIVQWSGVL
ncbi:MAG TPA: precorrin-6y C5,15-methyltransferase (decarboxylating) subunit CbiE [Sphingomonas sp.]